MTYNGKTLSLLPKLMEIISGIPELQTIVIIPQNEDEKNVDLDKFLNIVKKSTTLKKFLKQGSDTDDLEYAQVPFHHPLCILFSSGTTGVPKCLVHSVGVRLPQMLCNIYNENLTIRAL